MVFILSFRVTILPLKCFLLAQIPEDLILLIETMHIAVHLVLHIEAFIFTLHEPTKISLVFLLILNSFFQPPQIDNVDLRVLADEEHFVSRAQAHAIDALLKRVVLLLHIPVFTLEYVELVADAVLLLLDLVAESVQALLRIELHEMDVAVEVDAVFRVRHVDEVVEVAAAVAVDQLERDVRFEDWVLQLAFEAELTLLVPNLQQVLGSIQLVKDLFVFNFHKERAQLMVLVAFVRSDHMVLILQIEVLLDRLEERFATGVHFNFTIAFFLVTGFWLMIFEVVVPGLRFFVPSALV